MIFDTHYTELICNITIIDLPTSPFLQKKYQRFTVRSFTVLSKLKALQLSKVGLLTIKHQLSKNLTAWTDAT